VHCKLGVEENLEEDSSGELESRHLQMPLQLSSKRLGHVNE
jgi:hypothetical protein